MYIAIAMANTTNVLSPNNSFANQICGAASYVLPGLATSGSEFSNNPMGGIFAVTSSIFTRKALTHRDTDTNINVNMDVNVNDILLNEDDTPRVTPAPAG